MASHPVNLVLRFALELAADSSGLLGMDPGNGRLAVGLGYRVASGDGGAVGHVPGGRGSKEAPVRVPGMVRLALEAAFFATAVALLAVAGQVQLAIVFGVVIRTLRRVPTIVLRGCCSRSERARVGSHQQRAVAQAVEPVVPRDGFVIRSQDGFATREGAHEHQQGRARQVEVGEHDVHGAEAVARRDVEVRVFVDGDHRAPGTQVFFELAQGALDAGRVVAWGAVGRRPDRCRLQRADRGRADGDDAASAQLRVVDRLGILGREDGALGVNLVVLDVLLADGREGVQPDMQRA